MSGRRSKPAAALARRRGAARFTARSFVAIIGTGLIGASVGLAARAGGLTVIGWDSNAQALRTALRRKAVDRAASSMGDALDGAGTVILATPLDAILILLPDVFAKAEPGALVLHCAGVMSKVDKLAVRSLKRRSAVRFAAAHPIAGSERSGPGAASHIILKERVMALYAPPQAQRSKAWATATRFTESLGMIPIRTNPKAHDRAMAALSALPQLASLALALAAATPHDSALRPLAGPGYRDATRLAASPFAIWKPGLKANRTEILRSVKRLAKRVHAVETALRRRDWNALARIFLTAAAARRRVYQA